eukprot:1843716-Amphidinium_carterae.1
MVLAVVFCFSVQAGNLTACLPAGRHTSDPAELTHGIDLSILSKRHPNATAALCAFQKDAAALLICITDRCTVRAKM